MIVESHLSSAASLCFCLFRAQENSAQTDNSMSKCEDEFGPWKGVRSLILLIAGYVFMGFPVSFH